MRPRDASAAAFGPAPSAPRPAPGTSASGPGRDVRSPSGRPLSPDVRDRMQRSFGHDFSAIRLHAPSPVARALGVHALARGDELHVSRSTVGLRVVGHELAHVVQQRAGRVVATGVRGGAPVCAAPALEAEADLAGARAARGETARLPGGAPRPERAVGVAQFMMSEEAGPVAPAPRAPDVAAVAAGLQRAQATFLAQRDGQRAESAAVRYAMSILRALHRTSDVLAGAQLADHALAGALGQLGDEDHLDPLLRRAAPLLDRAAASAADVPARIMLPAATAASYTLLGRCLTNARNHLPQLLALLRPVPAPALPAPRLGAVPARVHVAGPSSSSSPAPAAAPVGPSVAQSARELIDLLKAYHGTRDGDDDGRIRLGGQILEFTQTDPNWPALAGWSSQQGVTLAHAIHNLQQRGMCHQATAARALMVFGANKDRWS